MPAPVCQIAKKTHERVPALLSQRLSYLRDQQRIENAELRELLGLGNSPSAQVEASRYLKKWSQPDGFLNRQRVGKTHAYTLRPKAWQ